MVSLASYETAIEMAFSANLLLPAWATVYRTLNKTSKQWQEEIIGLEEDDMLKGESDIRFTRTVTNIAQNAWKYCWKIGVPACVISASFLYLLMWDFWVMDLIHPEFLVPSLYIAAFAGPILMLAMYIFGFFGKKWIACRLQKHKRQSAKRQERIEIFLRNQKSIKPDPRQGKVIFVPTRK